LAYFSPLWCFCKSNVAGIFRVHKNHKIYLKVTEETAKISSFSAVDADQWVTVRNNAG
tara:strand:- start:2390 stop:2563 length:174 start_codon:yes stop_codon:yes gene_type:complete